MWVEAQDDSNSWAIYMLATTMKHTVISRLSTHPVKYAFLGKKFRVQDLLVEHVVNRHLV
jgi:hypothetical protein